MKDNTTTKQRIEQARIIKAIYRGNYKKPNALHNWIILDYAKYKEQEILREKLLNDLQKEY